MGGAAGPTRSSIRTGVGRARRAKRAPRLLTALIGVAFLLTACRAGNPGGPASPPGALPASASSPGSATADPAHADQILKVINEVRASSHLKATIVRVMKTLPKRYKDFFISLSEFFQPKMTA